MSLQEKLDWFKKRQEKCQVTLTSTAAKAGTTRNPSKPLPFSAPAAAKAPVPAVKFSDDTERLQYINSIRKSTVGSQIKRVIDLLYETRQELTPEQINEACYVDIHANKAVFDKFGQKPKVHYDGRRFYYKDIAYPNDPKVHIKVDAELKQLFKGIELPRDMLDIEKDLHKNRMKPATNTANRRAAAQVLGLTPQSKTKKKKHEISNRTKLTNVHLPELFLDLGSCTSR